jgi:uncharacterized protein (TIGR02145 family)
MKSRLILLLLGLVLVSLDILAQIPIANQPQRKIALVIGNGSYISSELANSENDAKAMKVALQSVGFTVLEYENLTQGQMKKAMDDFGMRLKGNDVGLFFYAGHGIQSRGYNYLIPVDAQLKSEEEVEYDCVQADRILAKMEGSGTKVNIIILDACRNNPFERSWTRSDTGKGLAFMNAPRGSLIAYATSPGSTASDGSGNNGLYTSAILESIKIPNITILEMFQNVRNIVVQKSNNQQTPWESTSLTGNFYFNNGEIISSEIQSKIQANPINEMPSFNGNDYIIDSRDNQRYKTVKISDQVWMAENLKATKFNDGSTIPTVQGIRSPTKWYNIRKSPAYCWYYDDEAGYKELYGALYNYYAVKTGRLCPIGWHIPNDAEWTSLLNFLGGIEAAGGKLKEIGCIHWAYPNTESSNESGFTALPGGIRINGYFQHNGQDGYWWGSTGSSIDEASYWRIYYDRSNVQMENIRSKIGAMFPNPGVSVRCLKDN